MEKYTVVILVFILLKTIQTFGTLIRINTEHSGLFFGNVSENVINEYTLPRKWWRTEFKLSSEISTYLNSDNIIELHVLKYLPRDEEIEKIEGLTSLVRVDIQSVQQKENINFSQLPRLKEIWIENNKIRFIDTPMFRYSNVKSLHLANNEIVSIQDNSFGIEIIRIELPCNRLRNIKNEWFSNPSILEVLDLTANYIEFIPVLFFRTFTSLRSIFLSYNHVHSIGIGAFAGRNNFLWLKLGYNHLTELKSSVFLPWNITIRSLDIQQNKLTFLPQNLTKRLTIQEKVLLEGNPWQCSCYFNEIRNWILTKTNNEVREQRSAPICATLMNFNRNVCLEEISYATNELVNNFLKHTSNTSNNRFNYCSCLKKKKDIFICHNSPDIK